MLLAIGSTHSFGQADADSLLAVGNKFYKNKEFSKAGSIWKQAAAFSNNKLSKQTNYYYAAHAYAEAKDSLETLECLELAITKNAFNDIPALKDEAVFNFLHTSTKWKTLIASIKPVYTTHPLEAKVVDSDVINFWQAYDKVKHSPKNAAKIYEESYIQKGSMALQYYYVNKIESIDNFILMHNTHTKYYASIKAQTLQAGKLKPAYMRSFLNLKKIYPKAIFPPVYFVIGKLRSAGTSCSYGLILGIDQACLSATADTSELNTWEKNNISLFKNLPHTVAHELIHFQQAGMANDTSLLKAAILEGMADFIGELISGKSSNERLKLYAIGKEKAIWESFKKDMYLDRANNWIGNADQETADKPADLGYWIGYQICKAYYENASDKQKAIDDMLHIQNYPSFLAQSKWEEKITTL
jgi:tetratricopeptide (TPR) repeat protein